MNINGALNNRSTIWMLWLSQWKIPAKGNETVHGTYYFLKNLSNMSVKKNQCGVHTV